MIMAAACANWQNSAGTGGNLVVTEALAVEGRTGVDDAVVAILETNAKGVYSCATAV